MQYTEKNDQYVLSYLVTDDIKGFRFATTDDTCHVISSAPGVFDALWIDIDAEVAGTLFEGEYQLHFEDATLEDITEAELPSLIGPEFPFHPDFKFADVLREHMERYLEATK